jgi:hypothetical protein
MKMRGRKKRKIALLVKGVFMAEFHEEINGDRQESR